MPATPFTSPITGASTCRTLGRQGWPRQLGFAGYPGVYFTNGSLTVQFAHLFPAWLAQAFSVAGFDALIRLNLIVGMFGLLAIYGLAKRFVASNSLRSGCFSWPSTPRRSGLHGRHYRDSRTTPRVGRIAAAGALPRWPPRRSGVWAGVLLGASAFIRIDAFLLVPFLLLGHALWNVATASDDERPSWQPIYQGSMPLFAIAFLSYVLFSRSYLDSLWTQILMIAALTLVSLAALGLTRIRRLVQIGESLLTNRRIVLGALGFWPSSLSMRISSARSCHPSRSSTFPARRSMANAATSKTRSRTSDAT